MILIGIICRSLPFRCTSLLADQIVYPHLLKHRHPFARAKTYRHPIYRPAADYPLITAPNATPIPARSPNRASNESKP